MRSFICIFIFCVFPIASASTGQLKVGNFSFSFDQSLFSLKKGAQAEANMMEATLEHKTIPERAIRFFMMRIKDKEWQQFKKTKGIDIIKMMAAGLSRKNQVPPMGITRKAGIFEYVFFESANPSGRKFYMTLGYSLKGRNLMYVLCGQDAKTYDGKFLPIKQIDKVNNTKACVTIMEAAK